MVHPSFATITGEMTGAEARLFDFLAIGGYFPSYENLISALGFPLDHHRFGVAIQNLVRLGFVASNGPAKIEPPEAYTPALKQSLAQITGAIHIEESEDVVFGDGDTARVSSTSNFSLTALGKDFMAVVGKQRPD